MSGASQPGPGACQAGAGPLFRIQSRPGRPPGNRCGARPARRVRARASPPGQLWPLPVPWQDLRARAAAPQPRFRRVCGPQSDLLVTGRKRLYASREPQTGPRTALCQVFGPSTARVGFSFLCGYAGKLRPKTRYKPRLRCSLHCRNSHRSLHRLPRHWSSSVIGAIDCRGTQLAGCC